MAKVIASLDLVQRKVSEEINRQLRTGFKELYEGLEPEEGLVLEQVEALVRGQNPFDGIEIPKKPLSEINEQDWVKRHNETLEKLKYKLSIEALTVEQFKAFLAHQNPFADAVIYVELVRKWEEIYNDVFQIKADFSNLRIPPKCKFFNRLLSLAKGIGYQELSAKCKELFGYKDLTGGKDLLPSDRDPQEGPYAIWVRNQAVPDGKLLSKVEPGEDLGTLSIRALRERGLRGITVEERLWWHIVHFIETERYRDPKRRHLDSDTFTCCSDSHFFDFTVPTISWDGEELSMGYCDPNEFAFSGYIREVICL